MELTVAVGLTVMALVAITSEHPPVPVIVYEIVALPAAIPVTSPKELTAPMVASLVVQAPPVSPFEVNWEVPSIQTVCVPESVPALTAVTVTVRVAVWSVHPFAEIV